MPGKFDGQCDNITEHVRIGRLYTAQQQSTRVIEIIIGPAPPVGASFRGDIIHASELFDVMVDCA